ncbi:hypothetical protein DEF23_15295 [Marinitenerispora sediminis]|nr:hypothetical protein DEF23_15295 [Marinitenerispora sediminis]
MYLRGGGNSEITWDAVTTAMHARGWVTVTSRTDAWHLQRGGCPVVQCDFSMGLDRSPGNSCGYHLFVRLGLVRARHCPDIVGTTLGAALPTGEWVRLSRASTIGQSVLETRVAVSSDEPELVWLNLTEPDRPYRRLADDETATDPDARYRLDTECLADLVAAAFTAGKTMPAPQPQVYVSYGEAR